MCVYWCGTCWLGNWHSTEVMLLAYWAISFLMAFSTAGGMRPDTLVMMSWSSNSGSDGSRIVFINLSTHSFNWDTQRRETRFRDCWASGRRWADVCMNSYLSTEERLRKTVSIHNVNEMIQCAVENSVELLSSQSNSLDRRQGPCVQLCL